MSETDNGSGAPLALLPPEIAEKIRSANAGARRSHLEHARQFREMSDDDLLETTKRMMRNLDQADEGPDRVLRSVLVPECWERIRPGTRDGLRSIITTLAEWSEETKSNLTLAIRSRLGPDGVARIRGESERLRKDIEEARLVEPLVLVEKMISLIGASRAYEGEGRLPTDPVYEPAFAYCLVPEIARRMLERSGQQP